MKHLKILVQVPFATSKVVIDIQYKKHCIRVASHVVERLKTQDIRKLGNIGNITKMAIDRAQYPIFLAQMKNLVVVVKNYPKTDFKDFFSCIILLDFLTLFHRFCPPLQGEKCRSRDAKKYNNCRKCTPKMGSAHHGQEVYSKGLKWMLENILRNKVLS